MKTCCRCRTPKELNCFGKNRATKDGLEKRCKDCRKIYSKENMPAEYERVKKYVAKNRERVRTYFREYFRERRKKIDHRILAALRARVTSLLRGKDKSSTTMELLGCNLETFKTHLASKFVIGMNFQNYGKWEIDHIIPCKKFNMLILEEQKRCFNYTNLQPLWLEDNRSKGSKCF